MTAPQASRRQGGGLLTVPGDKSIAHRALIFAALARGTSHLRNVPAGLDVRSTQRALRALGVAIDANGGDVTVIGSRGALVAPAGAIDCGNSGTTIRLLAGVLATRALAVTLDGDGSLRARPMRRIASPLEAFGTRFELAPGGTAPVVVHGNGDAPGADVEIVVPSAQVKSAVLLAALGAHGRTRVRGMLATRDHTERLFRTFGVRCERDGDTLVLDGPQTPRAADFDVPGDLSSAAFLLAAAAAVPGASVSVDDVGLNPTRTAFLDVLRRFGASVETDASDAGDEPRGRIRVAGARLQAIAIAPDEVPGVIDELPLVGVLGAFARGTTIVRGAAELRVKESDRIETFARAARAIGVDVETFDDGFAVHGPARFRDATVATAGDHRIAMAFAVAGRAAGVDVRLDDPECVAVSFPGFAEALERVG
ncbi:MAG TPA: 3-phosphoshikimate 1-carboxyvinyltransferase [Candidatus Elarobacter sp.]|jgi:3-phosphoshikimate 1-carboxyvinyltransferase|nr:3-phosphoshikimate 1-carboxyvinyltransferase [Candidatus Elarobacter sp.]